MRVFIRGLGELLITAGLVVLLFAGYELWGTGRYTEQQQDALADDLRTSWESDRGDKELTEVAIGQGLGVIRIPEFGDDYHFVVVQGIGVEDLKKGPGHYPGTAMPGEVGNFVLSGHRTTYSAPFNRLGELEEGDPIVVETRKSWYVYRVTEQKVVQPTAIEVIEPVPGRPDAKPKERMITLTTCHPKYSAAERLVIHGELIESQHKDAGPPAVLTAGQAGG